MRGRVGVPTGQGRAMPRTGNGRLAQRAGLYLGAWGQQGSALPLSDRQFSRGCYFAHLESQRACGMGSTGGIYVWLWLTLT